MDFGEQIGRMLHGGEVIELVGDVGAGKTTFTKGLGRGLGIDEDIQSPSFTISRVYDGRDDLRLVHYDFYRLSEAGIMANELADAIMDQKSVIVVEWADAVQDVLPKHHTRIRFTSPSETTRQLDITTDDEAAKHVIQKELM